MNKKPIGVVILSALLLALVCVFVAPSQLEAQSRGLYTPGMNATNSGVLPDPGLTYVNYFQLYSFNQLKGPDGGTIPVDGSVSVIVDQNIFYWVSKMKLLGANFAMMADLPVASNALSSVRFGALGGGSGFADSFYQPLTLGWHLDRADITAAYSFSAPTGRYNAGASNNVGSGYWGNYLSAGETFYLTKNKGTALSAYQVYEFHTTQKGTDVHPGQTFDLDYSLTQVLPLQKDMKTLLQLGFIGYGQWQTSDKSGPEVDPAIATSTHYTVNAMGVAANIILPARKTSLGMKYFKEFSNSSTVQGYSLQIFGAITF